MTLKYTVVIQLRNFKPNAAANCKLHPCIHSTYASVIHGDKHIVSAGFNYAYTFGLDTLERF